MKNIFHAFLFVIMSVSLFAQTSLTYKNNALVPGDSFLSKEIQYIDPGGSGPNQIWDFSKIQYTGKTPVVNVEAAPAQKLAGISEYNMKVSENGYEYYYNLTENGFEEKAYLNKESKLTLYYSDPLVKMKYPFSYGEQYSDHFTGNAWYNETKKLDLSGDFTMIADAFGTLILPEMVIKNVLRVKATKQGVQINMCGTTQASTVKYFWYAPGYRYPVFTISTLENRYYGRDTVITRSAYENLQQPHSGSAIAGTIGSEDQVENGDVSVIIFPNPFKEKVTYNYFLRKQLPVSIDLYDMSGKYKIRLAKTSSSRKAYIQANWMDLHTD